MNIKVFKMINGEELISEVSKDNGHTYDLKNPASIMLQPTPNGQMGVGIAPYMPYASTPDQGMENEYNRIFGSGIQVVSAGALSGLK
jgi:hypothetical protein